MRFLLLAASLSASAASAAEWPDDIAARSFRYNRYREAQQAQQSAQEYQERASNSELVLIDNGIASATRELEAYEAEYTRAAEAGEFNKMATIQTKLSKAAAKLDRLEADKSSFEQNTKRQPTTEGRVVAPETTATPNISERYLAQFSPVAQNWLRQHPDCWPAEYGGSQQKNSKMMAGHYDAIAQNLSLNSPEYFKVIEEHVSPPTTTPVVRDQQVASKAAEIQVAGETTRPKAQPSAPVSREAPSSSSTPRNVREVRLTKDQQEMARVSFPHLTEAQAFGQYARNLIELTEEGKIGRTSH